MAAMPRTQSSSYPRFVMKDPEPPPQPPVEPVELPFPGSLCHRCAAPPRYVKTRTSTFILCPILPNKYPRQPVVSCPAFKPR